MLLSTSCREGQPMIVSQQSLAGFIDEMAANRQLTRHAIPKNQNALDEEVTKSTVKCYHSPARTREQESWKREKNEGTWKPGSDSYAFRRWSRGKNSRLWSHRERDPGVVYLLIMSESSLLIGHIWSSELRRPRHFRTYLIRGRKLTPFFIQRAMCVSRQSLYLRVTRIQYPAVAGRSSARTDA